MAERAVAVRDAGSLTTSAERFTREDIELIRQTVCADATDPEFRLFLNQAVRTGLDPLARQIYSIPRSGGRTIQTGIDGYRLIAERTGLYAGSDDPLYDSEEEPQPRRATVTVWKLVAGERCPFTATARWDEYKPAAGQDHMWRKMPYLMLAKCAEALALRKAFPQELSGIYTDAEMDQAIEPAPPRAPRPAALPKDTPVRASIMNTPRAKAAAPRSVAPFSAAEIASFWEAGRANGWTIPEKQKALVALHPEKTGPRGTVDVTDLSREQYTDAMALWTDHKTIAYSPDGSATLADAGPPESDPDAQPTEG